MGLLDIADQLIIMVVLAIVCLLFLIADTIIFCYWFSYKYREYSYEQRYGPVLRFPPRNSDEVSDSELPVQDAESPPPPLVAPPKFDFLPVTEEIRETAESKPEPRAAYLPQADANRFPEEEFPPVDPNLLSAQGGIRSPFAATWSLVHPFVGIQVLLLAVNILSIPFLLPAILKSGVSAMTSRYGISVIVGTLFLQNVGFVGMSGRFVRSYGSSLSKIGLRKPTSKELALGLGFGFALLFISMGLEKSLGVALNHLLSKQFMEHIEKITNALAAGGIYEGIHNGPLKVMFAVAGAVAAPIGEEVFFRGLLYNGLKRRWGITAGVLISALCFALIHAAPVAVIVIFPMGIALALAYQYTGSLWVTIIMHAVNNASAFILSAYLAKPGH